MNHIEAISRMISEDPSIIGDYFAAVACVEHDGRWLLGLSTSDDDRRGKWVFPGGGIEDGETPAAAARRECWEETGVACRPIGGVLELPNKPGVAFLYCRVLGHPIVRHNREFSDMRFFSIDELRRLPNLYNNVLGLIARA